MGWNKLTHTNLQQFFSFCCCCYTNVQKLNSINLKYRNERKKKLLFDMFDPEWCMNFCHMQNRYKTQKMNVIDDSKYSNREQHLKWFIASHSFKVRVAGRCGEKRLRIYSNEKENACGAKKEEKKWFIINVTSLKTQDTKKSNLINHNPCCVALYL